MQNNEKEQRFLDKIEINFNSYGENKGRYTGRIRYQNGEHEAFDFIIRPDIAERYISLIAEDVVERPVEFQEIVLRFLESIGIDLLS